MSFSLKNIIITLLGIFIAINTNAQSITGVVQNEKGNPICETSKFEGHNSFDLSRLDTIDSIIIGPLPEKPKEMIIEILDSKNYPELIPKCKVQ